MNDEQNKDQLAANASAELTPEDQKIVAKRAKKKGVPVELAEEGRRQELNATQAQQLTIEYNSKLNALGFVLQPVLRRYPDSLVASFDLRPMDANELIQYKTSQEIRAKNANSATPAPTEPSKPTPTTDEPKVDDVEPAEIPA